METGSKVDSLRCLILAPLAGGFGLGVALRHTAYRRGWLRSHRLNRPVVSVGNLTVGGTGKTPLVALMADSLLKQGLKPVILTRGYRRNHGPDLVEIAPGEGRAPSPRTVGDEPALLARWLPEIPIIVCADRYRAGRVAEKRYDVDVHLLDDGFQHLALARDVDIVALDATRPLLGDALLPAGRLREPVWALQRAHIVILTRAELADPGPLEAEIRRINPGAQVFVSTTKLCRLVDVRNGRVHPSGAFRGEPVYAFCGIGNPAAFFADLEKWGFTVSGRRCFRDHHVYGNEELAVLGLAMKHSGVAAVAVVTTEKDAINLPPLSKPEVPVLACVIQADIERAQAFEEVLFQRLEACSKGL